MISIKDYAKKQGVSYEAIRKQVNRYKDELGEHLIKRERTQYLDEEGEKILDSKRQNNPVVYVESAEKQENADLKKELEELKRKYEEKDSAMNKMAESMSEILKTSNENAQLAANARLYLEQKDAAEEKFTTLESDYEKALEENQSYKDQIDGLQAELESLKNRSFFERLFNK